MNRVPTSMTRDFTVSTLLVYHLDEEILASLLNVSQAAMLHLDKFYIPIRSLYIRGRSINLISDLLRVDLERVSTFRGGCAISDDVLSSVLTERGAAARTLGFDCLCRLTRWSLVLGLCCRLLGWCLSWCCLSSWSCRWCWLWLF